MTLTVVILTRNEERHIRRALSSVAGIADRVFVIDSGSTYKTIDIAREGGADVLAHPFVTQAQQFNWALDQLPKDTGWVFRLDADEVVTGELSAEITERWISGLCVFLLPLHPSSGVSRWQGGDGIPCSAGLLVSISRRHEAP